LKWPLKFREELYRRSFLKLTVMACGNNIPSLEIGGDYYDVSKLKDGRYLIIIADVAGKGVASGLLVNTLNASLNAYIETILN